MNLKNEVDAWNHIDKVCDQYLAAYDTTIEEDTKILTEDDANGNQLGFNKRNCVLYRKSEKGVLLWMKDVVVKVRAFAKMTSKDVKKEVNRWNDTNGCEEYFK